MYPVSMCSYLFLLVSCKRATSQSQFYDDGTIIAIVGTVLLYYDILSSHCSIDIYNIIQAYILYAPYAIGKSIIMYYWYHIYYTGLLTGNNISVKIK